MAKVEFFTLHNDRGQAVLDSELSEWVMKSGRFEVFGPVLRYSWMVADVQYEKLNFPPRFSLHELPDASGLIEFERAEPSQPNNCLLLNAYGKERKRLTVPWELTKPQNPESAKPPTSFSLPSAPYINPNNGKSGTFGITAWVEYAGKYYFELDYHRGEFLWGREIRD